MLLAVQISERTPGTDDYLIRVMGDVETLPLYCSTVDFPSL